MFVRLDCTVDFKKTGSEFYEFETRLKSAQNRFKLSADFNLETLNTIGTIHIWAAS